MRGDLFPWKQVFEIMVEDISEETVYEPHTFYQNDKYTNSNTYN